jgi:hypothetical protein
MCNSIFIGKSTLPKAKDGEEYEVKIKGVYHTDEDGVRKFDVMSVDGKDVIPPDEGESECGCDEEPHLMDQDADDAMRIFFIKTKK